MSNPPATLPANFFESPAPAPVPSPQEAAGAPPSTLPANFFEQASMGAQPSMGQKVMQGVKNVAMDPFKLPEEVGSATEPIENYTQEGRAEHPILSKVGDITKSMKEFARVVEEAVKATGGGGLGAPEAIGEGAAKIGETAGKAVDAAKSVIPSSERAGQVMSKLKEAIGTHPVEMTDELSQATSRAQELADNGNTLPTAMRKFINRVTDPEKGHLTYTEARDFLTKFGGMTAEEATKIAPAMGRQIKGVAGALRNALSETAGRAGKLEEFQSSMKEYSSAKKLEEITEYVKEYGKRAVIGGAVGGGAAGAYEGLKKLLE